MPATRVWSGAVISWNEQVRTSATEASRESRGSGSVRDGLPTFGS